MSQYRVQRLTGDPFEEKAFFRTTYTGSGPYVAVYDLQRRRIAFRFAYEPSMSRERNHEEAARAAIGCRASQRYRGRLIGCQLTVKQWLWVAP